jgi:hypothetical protein
LGCVHAKLIQAQELMRHEVPRGDFVAVFDRALDLLIAQRKKKLFGLRTSSRSADEASVRPGESNRLHTFELDEVRTQRKRESNAPAQGESPRSKHIPRAVRREVMARDGYQCTFMGPEGNRCPERGRLQLEHYPVPAGCGGASTTDNLRVRCAAHNLLAAEHFYGRDLILNKIAAPRAEVSVPKNQTSRGPERVAADVGSPRLETSRTLRADNETLRQSADGSTQNARSSA